MRSHQSLDQRSLALHKLIAQKIRRNPSLFAICGQTLERWELSVSPSSQPYVSEWRRLFEQGIEACIAVVTEDSERGRAMRQASPFSGILTHKERFAFFQNWARNYHETQ